MTFFVGLLLLRFPTVIHTKAFMKYNPFHSRISDVARLKIDTKVRSASIEHGSSGSRESRYVRSREIGRGEAALPTASSRVLRTLHFGGGASQSAT